ncbi:hypothetical protein BDM02DRAFT_3187569 [Thelephora ganbajun]|uniref:Uncharacterized protein n=1 Tax=Thelephora ganbajun TaxID=370292 RepID=A0ACB6ZEH3_THEGA|nr:hypothetical protein BDM02DRAFT_3187569 [Thelephora ganbajun]
MPTSIRDKFDEQRREELEGIARVSLDIRRAVTAALPTPPEQFLTLNVPGKVLNFKDFTDGWDDAILCDDMPTLSGIQLGPTGRSIAQSYGATLSRLCPNGSTTGIPDDTGSLSDEEKHYQIAMEWLLAKDPDHPKQSRIDLYKEKQTEYTDAFERKIRAFNDALERVMADPRHPTLKEQREAYDTWVQENQKTYNNHIQAAYMDWVTTGKKEEVEYYFAIVDNDSAMSRVEASKKAMRNAIISDPDGTAEYNKVMLTPSNWAWLALKKMKTGPPEETEETLTYKITRLMEINAILQGTVKDPSVLSSGTGDVPDLPAQPKDLPSNVDSFLRGLKEYQTALTNYQRDTSNKDKKNALETANKNFNTTRDTLSKGFGEIQRAGIGLLNQRAAKSQDGLFENQAEAIKLQIVVNEAKITAFEDKLKALVPADNASSFQDVIAQSAGIPPPLPDAPANVEDAPDFWTKINVEVSSRHTEQSQTKSSSYSVGGSVGWGLVSIGGSHSQSADAARQMANASVKVSFECMRVDITRSWLRGELFYDDGLKVLKDDYVSPGPDVLSKLIDPEKDYVPDEDEKLTPFILAANVVFEITGETSDIQSHFSTSTSAGTYLGYGPFSIGGSYSNTSTSASSTCEATANGCKITIKSPQVIGWVSQIVPALPRVASTQH